MKVALYSRVSTKDKGQEIDNQVNQLRDFCNDQRFTIVHEYADRESGCKPDRAEFQKMLRDAATGTFELVLFWALDRFTREGTLATLRYLETLEGYGVRWRSLTEPWLDSAGPLRDVIISLLASLAKQERTPISERIKAGLARAKSGGTRSGQPIGRPRVVFCRDLVIELRGQGLSWNAIARKMGVSKSSIRRACQLGPV